MKFKVLSVVTATLTVVGILFFDRASKAQFAGSCPVPNFEIYQHDDSGGGRLRGCRDEYNTLRDDSNVINDFNWNDEASSIRTGGAPVSLYSDSQFQGSCIVVSTRPSTDGNFHSPPALNLRPLGFNDVVSSIRVGRDSRCTDLTTSSSVLAQNPNNLQVQFREYNSTLNYDRAQGTCQVVTSRREVVQTLPCRQSWTQIAYAGRRILFYDRNARQIVIHVVNPPNGTIGSTLRTYGSAERVRGTWATITHIGNGVFRFTDDNGQFEDYTISPNDYSLVRVRR
jgi:hypothetical protein